jgi:cell wall-associated NlpC family hydrolase
MAEEVTLPWTKIHPKVVAAAVVGGIVYVLGAFGVDLSTVVQEVENAVGVDLPDTQALTVGAAALIAGYIKKTTTDVEPL